MNPILWTSFLLLVTGIGAYETTTPHIILEGGPNTAAPNVCCPYPFANNGVNIDVEGKFSCNETLTITCRRGPMSAFVAFLGIPRGETYPYYLETSFDDISGTVECDTKTGYWDYKKSYLGKQFTVFMCSS